MAYVKLEDVLDIIRDENWNFAGLINHIEEHCPRVNIAKVTYGKWYLHPDGSGTCSVCGRHQKSVWDMDNYQNYCGHCGADMRGEISDA